MLFLLIIDLTLSKVHLIIIEELFYQLDDL